MDNQDILDMCRRLASKYRNHQEFDDLVSTGVIVCLDLRAGGEKNPATLYHRARDAMNQYMNHGSSFLTYPSGRMGRDAWKEDNNEAVDYQDEVIIAVSLMESYELKNCLQKLMRVLSKQERTLLMTLYRNGNDLTDASKKLKQSRPTLTNVRDSIRNKIVTICDLTPCGNQTL
jgi:hypothetical protein